MAYRDVQSALPAVLHHRIDGVEPLVSQHATRDPLTAPPALRDVLFGATTCYALLDAAKVPNLPEMLERSGLQHLCLFKGQALEEAGMAAPWLVRLEEGNAFARRLFTRGKGHWNLWDAGAGMFLRSAAPIGAVQAHLRHFTRLQDVGGAWYYFRFWEPAVASAYFATFADRPDLANRWFLPRDGAGIEAIVTIHPETSHADVFTPGDLGAVRAAHLLTQRDVDLLARVRRDADCDRFAINLRQTFGVDIAMPDDALRDFTRHAVDRLMRLGFRQRDTLFVMLAWEVFFGPEFERKDPDLARILHSDRDEAERFEALKDRMAQFG